MLPPARTALFTNVDENNMLMDSDDQMTSLSDSISQCLDLDWDLVKMMRPLSDIITEPLHLDCSFYAKIGIVKVGLLPIKLKLAL